MGLSGNSSSDSPKKSPVIIVNPCEETRRKSINMDKHVTPVKVTVGHADKPENDDPKDNVFMALYNDPKTFAPNKRVFYLSRHGESQFNLYGKIGGNAHLSSQGLKYAIKLGEFFNNLQLDNFNVWTSELIRTHETAHHIKAAKTVMKDLNEIESGDFDAMTYEAVAEQFPVEFALRDQDKLRYRYPSGESYIDVCRRLCNILPLMNQSQNLLVVSHQAVVRCIYTYLMKTPVEELPYVKIPLHTVMKVTFDGQKNTIESTFMNIECVDTHRKKPENCVEGRLIDDAITTVPQHL